MGIKFNPTTGFWEAFHSKRHPLTRQPVSLRRRCCESQAEAKRVEKQLVVQVEDKLREKLVPSWAAVVDEFIEYQRLRGLMEATLYSDESCLKKYTLPPWGRQRCDSISRAEILKVITESMRDRAESHKKYVLKCIRAAFNFAMERGYTVSNPTPMLKFRMGEKIKPVLTETQARLFLEKAWEMGAEWYPHWTMALYTGMRNGELYALKWDCMDLEQNKIKVCRSWNTRDGFKDTKSGDDRIIDIAPALLPLVQDLYATRIGEFVLPRLHKWDKAEQARDLRGFLRNGSSGNPVS
jgi:integrase